MVHLHDLDRTPSTVLPSPHLHTSTKPVLPSFASMFFFHLEQRHHVVSSTSQFGNPGARAYKSVASSGAGTSDGSVSCMSRH